VSYVIVVFKSQTVNINWSPNDIYSAALEVVCTLSNSID